MHLTPGAGALVNNVAADGPAFKRELAPGDVISAVAGHPCTTRTTSSRDHRAARSANPCQLGIVRGGQRYGAM